MQTHYSSRMATEPAKPSIPEMSVEEDEEGGWKVEKGEEGGAGSASAPSWWGAGVQKSVKKAATNGAAAVGKSVMQAAVTVDGKSSAVHAARIVGVKQGGVLGVKLNVTDMQEFGKRVAKLTLGGQKTKLRQIAKMKFKMIDINGDGVIDKEEVAIVMRDMGVLWEVFGEGDPEKFFEDCDRDGDGFISKEEFIKSFTALSLLKGFIER